MSSAYRITEGPLVPKPVDPGTSLLRRRCLLATVLVASGTLFWCYHQPLLESYANLFHVDDASPSDAIVMLLGGHDVRPQKAADLYRAKLASRIVLCSGPDAPPGLLSEAVASSRIMVARGVSPSAITVIHKPVASTRDEALAILPYAKQQGWKRITVVTTSFHTARARWIFRKIFHDSGIDIRVAAATDPNYDESNWFERDESVIIYLIETAKTILYRLRY